MLSNCLIGALLRSCGCALANPTKKDDKPAAVVLTNLCSPPSPPCQWAGPAHVEE